MILRYILPDKVYMAVLFWYLVKSDLYSEHAYTGKFTFYKLRETHDQVKLVNL